MFLVELDSYLMVSLSKEVIFIDELLSGVAYAEIIDLKDSSTIAVSLGLKFVMARISFAGPFTNFIALTNHTFPNASGFN